MPGWIYMDGLCQLPQVMGGEAAMQIFRLPSVLIRIPECSPGENSGVTSCARWIPSAWYTTLLFPLFSVGALRNPSFLQFCTLIRWVSLFAICHSSWDERTLYPKVTVMGERVGGETRTNILGAKCLGVNLKHTFWTSCLLSHPWLEDFVGLCKCSVLPCAFRFAPLKLSTATVPDIFSTSFLLCSIKMYLSSV